MENQYTCGRCGQARGESEFYKKKGKPSTSWCKHCYREWHAERVGGWVDRPCAYCANPVRITKEVKRSSGPVYCSRKCKDQHRDAQSKQARLGSKTERPCVVCGAPLPASSRTDRSYCSMDCRRKIDLHQRRRKAIRDKRLAAGEPCGICGLPVDGSLKGPDPMSASLDHINPLAAHGGHDDDNLQLTHLGCNARKGARH